MENMVVWFELPVKNLERAMAFYTAVLGVEMQEMTGMGKKIAFFPFKPGVASGNLVEDKDNSPSLVGPLVYLAAGDDLSVPLARVEKAGGKVTLPKTSLGPHGFMAHISDTEGNRVALHSMK